MPHELTMLGWSVVVGLVYIMTAGALSTAQRGLKWNAGNRDGEGPPLNPVAVRAARAATNFLETFPLFAASILAVVVANKVSTSTAFGADLYFWARCVYLPIYIIGVPYLRTAVWLVSILGLILQLLALLN